MQKYIDREEASRLVRSCLEEVASDKLRQCLRDLHPVDVAEVMPTVNLAQRVKILKVLESARAARVIMDHDHGVRGHSQGHHCGTGHPDSQEYCA
jgi:Mg/Co/Ni transporter MgtE